jgi:CRISPR/Cas system-associated exonuclease Cas4 (RecB family)
MRCPVAYDREATMAFLKQSLKVLLSPNLPPILAEDDEGKWECGFCPLAEVCASV